MPAKKKKSSARSRAKTKVACERAGGTLRKVKPKEGPKKGKTIIFCAPKKKKKSPAKRAAAKKSPAKRGTRKQSAKARAASLRNLKKARKALCAK